MIPFVTKKRKKKNYQEILSEYLNHLASAGNKLNSVSKEMKSQFFMNMNDMILNKNDELKYLILMREEFYKYKLKMYYFRKWRSRALYNHDLIDEENPFINGAEENYQNFKNLNYMQQGGLLNSNNNTINNSLKNSSILDGKIGNNPNLLIFDDEEKKNKEIKLEDSIKVLGVQKNINDALYNTSDIFKKYNNINNINNNKDSNENDKENQFNNILNNIERMKKNALYGDGLTNNKINGKNEKNEKKEKNKKNEKKEKNKNIENDDYEYNIQNFNDLLINKKNDNSKNIQKKNNLLSIKSQKRDGKSYKNKGEHVHKKSDIKNNEKDKSKSKSKSKKKFDPKELYKYKIKENDNNEEEKYRNSKYISTKYKDYLHSGEKIFNTKKSNSKQTKKLNDLYKEIQKNLESDENLLRRLELKRDISNQNIHSNKNRSRSKNKSSISLDRIKNNNNENNVNKRNNLRKYFKYDNTKNFEENLLQNGFFSGKNNKNENNDENEKEEESNVESYPENIREIIEKYKRKDENVSYTKEKKKIKNYDYIKKEKASDYAIDDENNYDSYYQNNIKPKRDENDYDEDYEELFHPKKNNLRDNNILTQFNTSECSNSIYNVLNNLDEYDNLINNLNQPKYNRINKRKIIRNPKKSKKPIVNYNLIENSISNNSSYILAPMKDIPITNISFRARMKYFSDKKQKNLEKMIKAKKEEEKQIYTFKPKTGENRLNVIKYDNYVNTEISNNKKRMPDYNRINNLYLDYKEKKIKMDALTKEYYKKAGISFTPRINDQNKEIKEFKNKIGQIPYLDRVDIYNVNKQNFNNNNNILNIIPGEIY